MQFITFFQQNLWLLTGVLPLVGQMLFWTLFGSDQFREQRYQKKISQHQFPKPQQDQIRQWAREWTSSPPGHATSYQQVTQNLMHTEGVHEIVYSRAQGLPLPLLPLTLCTPDPGPYNHWDQGQRVG